MSWRPFAEPLGVETRPSRLAAVAVMAVYAASALAVTALPLAPAHRVAVWLILALVYPRSFLAARSTLRLRCDRRGRWRIGRGGRRPGPIHIAPGTCMTRFGVFLHYRPRGSRWPRSAFIAADSLDAEEHRGLRWRLALSVQPGADRRADG